MRAAIKTIGRNCHILILTILAVILAMLVSMMPVGWTAQRNTVEAQFDTSFANLPLASQPLAHNLQVTDGATVSTGGVNKLIITSYDQYGNVANPSTAEEPGWKEASEQLPPDEPPPDVQRRFGYVQPPVDLSHLTGQQMQDGTSRLVRALPLPDRLDWRDSNKVTPVKDQGSCGSCYAFAAIANIESRLLVESGETHDFSENHAKECNYEELANINGGSSCYGGNYFMVANLFSQKGLVLESCDPYVASDVDCNTSCTYQKTLLDWRIISGPSIPDTNVLKTYIQQYGPVFSTMQSDVPEFINYDGSYTLHYTGTAEPDHAVLIVGWDDSLVHDGGTGGWIAKIGWGTGWGDNGYFTIAYGSANIGWDSSFAHTLQDYDENGGLMYYDEGGWSGDIGYGNTAAWGLCKFVPVSNTAVSRVEFWTTDITDDIDIYIYDNFDGNTPSNLLSSKENLSFNEAGYHSVALDTPLPITSGDDIIAVVKIQNSNYNIPIAVDKVGPYELGRSYTSPDGSAGSWTDEASYQDEVAIRLRTSPPPIADFTANITSGNAPLTVNFTDQSTGTITSWSWNFGDGETSTEHNPSHEYATPGTYTVSLTVSGPGGNDIEAKSTYITVNFVQQNQPPNKPINDSPSDGNTGISLTPILQSSAFSDTGDIHAASQWQITLSTGDYSSTVFDSGTDTTNLTSIGVPPGVLDWSNTYYWRVRHQDNYGLWSDWSMETSFATELRGSISGRVYQADGTTPLANVRVNVKGYDISDDSYGWTASDGSYTITGLSTGSYRVDAEAEGYIREYYDGVYDYGEATPVSVSIPDDTPNIDFSLDVGGSISVHVYQANGTTPIANVEIYARDYDTDAYDRGWTATDGSYTIPGLPLGNYKVRAHIEGYVREYYDGVYSSDDATPVSVTIPEDTPNIDFTLDVGASISGNVYQADGTTPISGASINAELVDGDYDMWANTASDGSYTLAGLPSGEYRVRAEAKDYIREYYQDTYIRSEATPVSVTIPEDTPNIDFTLDVGASISGNVYQADGTTPISGASINADLIDGDYGTGARTSSDGSYTVTCLPSGNYRVSIRADGYILEYYDGTYNYSEALPVSVTVSDDTPNIDFTLDVGGSISGHVYQADGITPVLQAWVYAETSDGTYGMGRLTNYYGNYTIQGLLPSDYKLSVEAADYFEEYYDSVHYSNNATLINVSPSEEIIGINFILEVDDSSSLPGDANGDGSINAIDITKVEREIVGLDPQTPGADANQDGSVDALDITKVERIIAGLD